jgi:hypothetical protein
VNRAKSKTDVVNYARRHNERFSAEALADLEAYFAHALVNEASFTASVPNLTVLPLDRFVQYCRGVRAVRAERVQQLESSVAGMMVHGENAVPNVRHSGFTAAQRRAAIQEAASNAEYSTAEAVNVGEYIFASVQEDNPDYQLPLSFGLVLRMVDVDGEAIDASTEDDDVLTISWFGPVARHDQQKYGPGKWELLKGAAAGTLDFRSDIERGSVVLAGIEESKLTQKSFQRGNRHQLIKCTFGKPLLRKLKELPTSVTRWDLYGVPNV